MGEKRAGLGKSGLKWGGVGPGGGERGGIMGIWGLLGVKLGGFVGLKEGEEGRNAGSLGVEMGVFDQLGGGKENLG